MWKQLSTLTQSSNRIGTYERTITAGASRTKNRDMVYNDAGRFFQLLEEGDLNAEYFYNDQGQRTRKIVYDNSVVPASIEITVYHYDRNGSLITETDEQGNLIKDYIWVDGMRPVAQIDNTLGLEQLVYLLTDHLMTSRLATDQGEQVVWRWEGEAFGNTPAQELAGVSVNLRFPGQYFDQERDLHYNYFRDYDPSTGRYVESDPIGLAGGISTYQYASANPLNWYDRVGLAPCEGNDCFDQYKKCRSRARKDHKRCWKLFVGDDSLGIRACNFACSPSIPGKKRKIGMGFICKMFCDENFSKPAMRGCRNQLVLDLWNCDRALGTCLGYDDSFNNQRTDDDLIDIVVSNRRTYGRGN